MPNDDRVADALYHYAEQETRFRLNNHMNLELDKSTTKLRLDFYQNLLSAYRKSATPTEKNTLRYVRKEARKLKARLEPSLLNNFFYSRASTLLWGFLFGKSAGSIMHTRNIANIQKDALQQYNLYTVQESMRRAGFNHNMEGTIKKMLDLGMPSMHFHYADVTNPKTNFVLHFKKNLSSGSYYFEKFDAISRPSLNDSMNSPSAVKKTFSQIQGESFTAKEASSLVNNEPVYKNYLGHERWITLANSHDTNQHPALNFINMNLEKQLTSLPIKDIQNKTVLESVVKSLKNGNTKDITLTTDNQRYAIHIHNDGTLYLRDKHNRYVDPLRYKTAAAAVLGKIISLKESQSDTIDITPPTKKSRKLS